MQIPRKCQLYLSLAMVSTFSFYIFLHSNSKASVQLISGKYPPKNAAEKSAPQSDHLSSSVSNSVQHITPNHRYRRPARIVAHQNSSWRNEKPANGSSPLARPPLHHSVEKGKSAALHEIAVRNGSKLILLWTTFFGSWDYIPDPNNAHRTFQSSGCPVTSCEITRDRKRLKDSDSVVFHARDLSLLDVPRSREPFQKWVFFSLEAPPYSYFKGIQFMKGMFNWTMSYRRKSDIMIPYGRVKAKDVKFNKTTSRRHLYNGWKNKKKMAVWLVSHCTTSSKREEFVKELQKYVDIDIFGTCGFAACPKNKTAECHKAFEKRYLFFLSLENSICKDYVTEKFFRILQYDIIPVVLGGADYESIAPPHSYINALNFETPEELSHYLHKVAANYSLYESYLDWKYRYEVDDNLALCELCTKLHSPAQKSFSIYKDMEKWWIKNSECRDWRNESLIY